MPSASLDAALPALRRDLCDKDVVVFHCMLSTQRGPGAARTYLKREDEGKDGEGKEKGGEGQEKDGEQVRAKRSQQVYVLDGGFAAWREKFGTDERLTEGYHRGLWEA